jgi:tetratricopeptide (TPR) repeat protein
MKRIAMLLLMLLLTVPAAVLAQADDIERGQDLLAEGEFEDAVDAFTAALEEDARNVDALLGRAEAYASLGDSRRALADAERAIILDESSQAYYVRALALLVDGDFQGALDDLSTAAQLDPENPDAYVLQADIYSALGETEQALANYDAAIEIDPDNADYYYNRGLIYYNTGDLEAALEDYNAAIEIDPDNADYYFSRSYVHFDQGDLEATLEDDTRAIELAPDFASGYLNRGFHLWSDGQLEDAAVDYYEWITLLEENHEELDAVEKADTLNLEMNEGWAYFVPFSAPEASLLNVEVFSPGGLVDPVVVILNDEGVPIMVDDDGGFGLSALIEDYALPYQGDYTIVISHAGGGSFGDITAEIEIGVNFGNA